MSDELPADQGLSSLGLLMQLAGGLFAAAAGLVTFIAFVEPGGLEKLWVLLVLGSSVARSMLHRNAGIHLLYGNPGDEGRERTAGLRRYIGFALIHSVLVPALLAGKYRIAGKLVIALAGGLAVWPVLLAVLFALPRFRHFQRQLPIAEDKGFEGASILMTVLGLCGVVASSTALVSLVNEERGVLTRGPGILLALALVMLIIRSVLHLQAGYSGLRETGVDRAVELANRYANFGVISAFCCGGALLLYVMKLSWQVTGLATISGLCLMLMAWPLAIRRFYSDRQFADLLAGDDAPMHHRAPDAGLTGLGWLLLAHAAYSATLLVPQLASVNAELSSQQQHLFAVGGALGLHSIWLSLGVVVLQGWAGFELVRMSRHARWVAVAFGVIGTLANLGLAWPLAEIPRFSQAAVAISLILPVASVVLVTRKIAPSARARFRAKMTT